MRFYGTIVLPYLISIWCCLAEGYSFCLAKLKDLVFDLLTFRHSTCKSVDLKSNVM